MYWWHETTQIWTLCEFPSTQQRLRMLYNTADITYRQDVVKFLESILAGVPEV